MHGYISDLYWVMPQCTNLLHTIFIPNMESHNWVNTKNLASCKFLNDIRWHQFYTLICGEAVIY